MQGRASSALAAGAELRTFPHPVPAALGCPVGNPGPGTLAPSRTVGPWGRGGAELLAAGTNRRIPPGCGGSSGTSRLLTGTQHRPGTVGARPPRPEADVSPPAHSRDTFIHRRSAWDRWALPESAALRLAERRAFRARAELSRRKGDRKELRFLFPLVYVSLLILKIPT